MTDLTEQGDVNTAPEDTLTSDPIPTTSRSNEETRQIARVSIKPPEFYRKNPTVWFRQMESQFALSNINQSSTKFHHVMGALPEDVACYLPEEVTTYEQLKAQVLQTYQKTRHELLEEALGSISLDGQKPSVCLLRIKKKLSDGGLIFDEDIVRHRLLQAMPADLRIALSGHSSLPLNDFAKIADTIYGYQQESFNVAAVTRQFVQNRENRSYQQQRGNQRHGEGQRGYQSTSFQRNGHQQTADGNGYSVHPFSDGQKPKICRFHVFYADKANKCKPWCKWPGRKPQTIDPSSRAASPAPVSSSEN